MNPSKKPLLLPLAGRRRLSGKPKGKYYERRFEEGHALLNKSFKNLQAIEGDSSSDWHKQWRNFENAIAMMGGDPSTAQKLYNNLSKE